MIIHLKCVRYVYNTREEEIEKKKTLKSVNEIVVFGSIRGLGLIL